MSQGNMGVKEGYGDKEQVMFGEDGDFQNPTSIRVHSGAGAPGNAGVAADRKATLALAVSITALVLVLIFARRGRDGPMGPAGPVGGGIPANKPIDVLPPVTNSKPFEITGPRFADTAELKSWEVGRRWNLGDMTVRGTRGNDTILVDLHIKENGRFVRLEGCALKIGAGQDPSKVIEGFKFDSLVENLGNGRFRQMITGTEFQATLSQVGSVRIFGQC